MKATVPAAAMRLELPPLSLEAARQIVGEAQAAQLHERSGGNALFLTQLASSDEHAAPPESIQAAVLDRSAEAGAAARTLMSAAVLGASVDVDVLAAVLKTDPIRLLEDLDVGVRLGLLEARDGAYGFRHAIVREVLDASTASPRRALLHREAARVLSANARRGSIAGRPSRAAERREGASPRRRWLRRAVSPRIDSTMRRRSISPPKPSRPMTPLTPASSAATVQLRLTHFDAAQTDAGRALSSDADARALEVAGSVAYYHKDFERAASLGDALIQQASGAIQRVQGQVIRARALHAMGDVPGADELLTRAMATCRRQRLRPPTSIYAFLKVHTGEIKLALNAVETSPYAAEDAVSTIYTPVHGYAAHGYALATSGRAGEALDVLERATDEARRRGLTRYESLGVNLGAWVLRNIGEPAHARESNGVALVGASEAAYRELEVYATLDPGDDFIAEGNAVAANGVLERAHELMADVYAYRWRHELRVELLRGRIALLRGDATEALAMAARLMASAADRHAPRYRQLGAVLHLQARAALGDEPPSPATLAELSSSLSTIAGIEAWWVMADLGASLGSDACFAHAQTHRDRLAAHLDEPRRAAFLRYAGARTREHEDPRPHSLTALTHGGNGAADELRAARGRE